MAIIEVQADLKQTNKLLERVACSLERILLEAFKVKYGHCVEKAEDPNPKEQESVGYASDEETIKESLKELAGLAGMPEQE